METEQLGSWSDCQKGEAEAEGEEGEGLTDEEEEVSSLKALLRRRGFDEEWKDPEEDLVLETGWCGAGEDAALSGEVKEKEDGGGERPTPQSTGQSWSAADRRADPESSSLAKSWKKTTESVLSPNGLKVPPISSPACSRVEESPRMFDTDCWYN